MVFSSMTFLFVFFPLVLVGYFGIFQKNTHRNLFLLIASLIFYAWGEPYYVALMIVSICLNFRIGLMIDTATDLTRKYTLAAGIFLNLFFLFLFKYEGFFVRQFNSLVEYRVPMRIESLNLPLPIGISFFTFQAISYLVDLYRKQAPVQKTVTGLGLYIAFFPQLIAGPIVQYSTIAQELEHRTIKYDEFTQGVKRFIQGLAKKMILANQLALVVEESFSATTPSVTFAWLGAIAFSLQIYYDFSGYSDMAIGMGLMFGFHFPENFNYSFIANTITDFWRRHHMSLSRWFRDYVFFPLGGSRVSKPRMVLNLLVVWLLTGFWHGASYQFIAWGLFFFVLLSFEKTFDIPTRIKKTPLAIPYHVFTLIMIIFSMVLFGEYTFLSAADHIHSMLGLKPNAPMVDLSTIRILNNDGIVLLLGCIFATPVIERLSCAIRTKYQENHLASSGYEHFCTAYHLVLFYVSVSYLVMGAHNPFLYFNF
ncbi:MAG: MBOAT family O-acyltransferase [Eubacteriales bacterium]